MKEKIKIKEKENINNKYKTDTDVTTKTTDSNYDLSDRWMFDMLDNIKNGSED